MANSYDIIVIGSGPGGYVCAIKAAQLGLKTAVVEKMKTFGGTCLNIGCIPSKALLHASEMFHEAEHGLEKLGIKVNKPKLDFKALMAHKDSTVKANVDGIGFLFKKNKIDAYHGTGTIAEAGKVVVCGDDGKEHTLSAKHIVIATGSEPAGIPGVDVDIDEETIVSSTGALDLKKVPEHLIVVGGGVIGLEMGSVWQRLGAKVTVIEFLDKILGAMDGDVSKQFQRILQKQDLEFKLSSKVTGIEKTKKGAKVTFEPVKGGDAETLDADIVLVSTGRRAYTKGLGLEALGVEMNRDKIKTDEHWQTSVKGIYAIGDVIDGPMLALRRRTKALRLPRCSQGKPDM